MAQDSSMRQLAHAFWTELASFAVLLLLLDPSKADLVLDFLDPKHRIGDVFGKSLGLTAVRKSAQHDFAILHADFDIGGVNQAVAAQPLVDLFLNAIVRALVVSRTSTYMRSFLTMHGVRPTFKPSTAAEA